MPSSVTALLNLVGLKPEGFALWKSPVACDKAGIYLVSISDDPDFKGGLSNAPISKHSLAAWIATVPRMTIDDQPAEVEALQTRLEAFWLPDECILYIGKAGGGSSKQTLHKRIGAYYGTRLGKRSGHSGGHWIKTLNNLDSLFVHWSICADPVETEIKLIEAFAQHLSVNSRNNLFDPEHPYPFANLELTKKIRKHTVIDRATEPRRR